MSEPDDLIQRHKAYLQAWEDENTKPAPSASAQDGGERDGIPDARWVLPCDVRLPPATTIRKGCELRTLLVALRIRGDKPEHSEFPRPAPAAGERQTVLDGLREDIAIAVCCPNGCQEPGKCVARRYRENVTEKIMSIVMRALASSPSPGEGRLEQFREANNKAHDHIVILEEALHKIASDPSRDGLSREIAGRAIGGQVPPGEGPWPSEEQDEAVFELLRKLHQYIGLSQTYNDCCNAIDHIRKLRAAINHLSAAPPAGTAPQGMREALEPFARFAERADGPWPQVVGRGKVETGPGIMADAPDGRVLLKLSPDLPSITVGDFRRARAALGLSPEKQEE